MQIVIIFLNLMLDLFREKKSNIMYEKKKGFPLKIRGKTAVCMHMLALSEWKVVQQF